MLVYLFDENLSELALNSQRGENDCVKIRLNHLP